VAMYVYFPPVRASPIRQLEQGVSLVWDAERRKWFLDLRKVGAALFYYSLSLLLVLYLSYVNVSECVPVSHVSFVVIWGT
jgi:hypothetical protein